MRNFYKITVIRKFLVDGENEEEAKERLFWDCGFLIDERIQKIEDSSLEEVMEMQNKKINRVLCK